MASITYLYRENECIGIITNDNVSEKKSLIEKWKEIEAHEKNIRKDAKVYTHLKIQLPNEWKKTEGIKKVEDFLKESKIKNQEYAAFLHRGEEGEVAKNFHVHIIFNERNKETGKKDRTMSKLGFQKDFVKDFQKVYGKDIQEKINNIPKVNRIPMYQWKADPVEARVIKTEMRNLKKIEYGERAERVRKSFNEFAESFNSLSKEQQRKSAIDQPKQGINQPKQGVAKEFIRSDKSRGFGR